MLDHDMQTERNNTIDAIKGFAIILVVLAPPFKGISLTVRAILLAY